METKIIKEIVGSLIKPIANVIDDIHTSKIEKAEAMAQMQKALNEANLEVEKLGRDTIIAEVRSESWIVRNWRPIASLTFVAIIPAMIFTSFFKVGEESFHLE